MYYGKSLHDFLKRGGEGRGEDFLKLAISFRQTDRQTGPPKKLVIEELSAVV